MHSLSSVAWRGIALHGVSVRVISIAQGGAGSASSVGVYKSMGCFPRVSLGSSSGQQLLCILGVRLRMFSWLWLGSAFGVVAFVCF